MPGLSGTLPGQNRGLLGQGAAPPRSAAKKRFIRRGFLWFQGCRNCSQTTRGVGLVLDGGGIQARGKKMRVLGTCLIQAKKRSHRLDFGPSPQPCPWVELGVETPQGSVMEMYSRACKGLSLVLTQH